MRGRVDAGLRAASDEAVLTTFYGNPKNRRELWDYWRQGPHPTVSTPGRGTAGRPKEETPPSLEYCILDDLDRHLLQSRESDDALLDRLKREVASRLDDWSEATEDERHKAVHLTFALASLNDDRSILQDAVHRVEDLKEEFGALLRAPESEESPHGDADLETTEAVSGESGQPGTWNRDLLQKTRQAQTKVDSAFKSLHGLIEQVEDADALTIIGGFATDVEGQVQALRGGLASRQEEMEALKAGDELLSAAARFLYDVAKHPASAGIQADLESLAGNWRDLSHLTPQEAGSELARLQADVPPAVETLERSHEEYGALEGKRQQLRELLPTSREERRNRDDRLNALREPALAARDRHREAEDDLLAALAPTLPGGAAPTPEAAGAPPEKDSTSREAAAPAEPAAEADESLDTAEAQGFEDSGKPGQAPDETPDRPAGVRQRRPKGPPTGTSRGTAELDPEERVESEKLDEPKAVAPAPETPAPKWNEDEQGVRNALAHALADEPPRLAEAFQICRLAEELKIAAGQPRSAIVEFALYASHLQRAHGELASDLRDVIEGAPSEPQAGSTPEQENTEALIRFAGALVPALLAPHTGAAAWLKGLTHEGLPVLYRFAQQAAERSWAVQTAQMDVGAFLRRARRHLKQEDAMARIQQKLAGWRREEARLPLGYTPANKVWGALLNEGPLGELANAVATRASAAKVRPHLAELGDGDELRKCLDDLSSRLLRNRQSIDGRIFKQIQRRLNRPCELAYEYLDLIEATTEQADYRRRVVLDFVRLIQEDAPSLRQELDAVSVNKKADPLVRAAAKVAKRTLIHVENLVDPEWEADDSDEPAVDLIRASGLFLYPDIRIDDSGLVEGDADEALQALVSSPVADVEAALEERFAAADLQTVQRILNWSTSTELMGDDGAELWRERLHSSRKDHLLSLQEDAETLRDDLESAYLYGLLDQDDRLRLDARLASLEERIENRTVVRFDRSVAELDRLRLDLKRAKHERLQTFRAEARDRVPDDESDRLREIERHIDDGDLVAANEILFRTGEHALGTIEDLTGSGEILDSYLAADRDELRTATEDWDKVVDAAKTGQRHGSLAFDELDEDYRASASGLLEDWNHLRNCSRLNRAAVAKAARQLFSRIGFLDVRVQLDKHSIETSNAWTGDLQAASLTDRADCAVAQYGSLAGGRYRLLVCFEPPTGTQILQLLQSGPADQPAIVVCVAPLGDRLREQLTRTSFERKLPFVLLDRLLLAFLAAQARPRLATFFALSLPFSYCKPFQRRASLVPPEMFFGREREKSEISDFHGSCFLYGGRQLGKTALLRRVQEDFTSPEHGQFAVWIDLKDGGIGDADTADIWAVIWKHLRELEAIDETVRMPTRDSRSVEAFHEALQARFNAKTKCKLLLLLDEADNFLRRDALNSSRETFTESSRLKSLMEPDRAIKVVFAGLHNVQRTTKQSNHPLAHMGRPIRVGPFIQPDERRQAEHLLSVPLQACGYRFDPARLVRSILARTNYYPNLLQIYGAEIVDRLSQPDRRRSLTELPPVGPELLAGIHRDQDFQNDIRSRFEWTLQLDPRYEAIAYVLAHMCHDDDRILHDGTDERLLFAEVREWWKAGFGDGYDFEDFKALLEEMEGLGVLRRTGVGRRAEQRFSLRNPNVLALLGSAQTLEGKLLVLEEWPKPLQLGPREIRRRHDEKGPLHRPLTLQQEHEVAGRSEKGTGRNEVVLVCGTEATGVRHVIDFLRAGKGIGEVERLKTSRSCAAFERDVKNRLKARKHETTVFLCDATAEAWREDWLNAARGSLEKLRSRDKLARIVFTLDANRLMAHRQTIMERETQGTLRFVDLKPWSLDFAARCLDDDQDVGRRLDQKQERELADLAGGWPVLLDLVLEALRAGANPEPLTKDAGFHELLRENAVRLRLREAFALDHVELAAVLQLARELGTATEEELLDPEARELAACPLGDEELRSAIWAAGKLHLLQPTGPSEWRVNPVVATVLQTPPD